MIIYIYTYIYIYVTQKMSLSYHRVVSSLKISPTAK